MNLAIKQPAVVLLSGGLDSTTCLAYALDKGFECFALSINYGQRHDSELIAAARVAEHYGVREHRIVDVDVGRFGGSALTDEKIAVPDASPDSQAHIPITYVPARNTVMLSIALAWAEVLSAREIFVGVNAVDYSGYPDCRPEFIRAFNQLAAVATKSGVEGQPIRVQAPLQHLSKQAIIKLGVSLGVDYRMTVSCYQADPRGAACGNCDACHLRQDGFRLAEVADPTSYYSL